MSEISKYESYKKKLEGICEENDLTFRFSNRTYPITLTVRPLSDMYSQMDMLESAEEKDYRSQDSYLRFVYKDGGITYKTSETFVIGDALFSKLKNLFKNMHYCWLQYFFRTVIEREMLRPEQMPVIDEDEADDVDIQLPEEAEMLEEYVEDLDEELKEATRIVRMENKASTSLLQRRMNVDEEKAEAIMEQLEILGVVGPYNDGENREVLPYDEPEDDDSIDTEDGADNE